MSTQLKVQTPPYSGEVSKSGSSDLEMFAQRGNTRPEVQLLLACARTAVSEATAERIRTLLRGNIDWAYVIERAKRNHVTPLLCQSLNEVCHDLVPAEVLKILRDYANANAHYNLYRTGELIKLVRLFEANGIPALPFKGPVLSLLAYRTLGLRDYGDLDILVRPQDVLRTQRLLIVHGYHLITPASDSQTEPHFSPRNKDLIFASVDGRVRVELHWRLTGKHFDFPLDLDSLWERLDEVSLAGTMVRTLAPEDLLLYLCMHGSRHGWERLLWICDVAELLRTQPTMDWEWLSLEANRLGNSRTLSLGLILARDLLGLELSQQAWNKLHVDPAMESLALHLTESLFKDVEADTGISYWHNIHLRMRERLIDRLRLQLHYGWRYLRLILIPNERDHAILGVPSALPFLYYLLRPFRLIGRFGLLELKKRAGRLNR